MSDANRPAATSLEVFAGRYWNDTGLDVHAGDVLAVVATSVMRASSCR